MSEQTGAGDPARTMALLWRHHDVGQPATDARSARGPRPGLDVDAVVRAAIRLADAEGLGAVSFRRMAQELGVGTMTLYTYVPGKAELVDLMVDQVLVDRYGPGGPCGDPWPADLPWRARVEALAQGLWDTHVAHPWLRHVATVRPPMGPGIMAQYDHGLAALDGSGLDEIATDAVVTMVSALVTGTVGWQVEKSDAQRTTGTTEAQWWDAVGPYLEAVFDAERYPTAARVGPVVGEALQAAVDPTGALQFALARALDGVEALVAQARG